MVCGLLPFQNGCILLLAISLPVQRCREDSCPEPETQIEGEGFLAGVEGCSDAGISHSFPIPELYLLLTSYRLTAILLPVIKAPGPQLATA